MHWRWDKRIRAHKNAQEENENCRSVRQFTAHFINYMRNFFADFSTEEPCRTEKKFNRFIYFLLSSVIFHACMLLHFTVLDFFFLFRCLTEEKKQNHSFIAALFVPLINCHMNDEVITLNPEVICNINIIRPNRILLKR